MTNLIVHVIPLALKDIEGGTIYMAVFLTVAPGRENIQVGFNHLGDLHTLRVNNLAPKQPGATFPGPILTLIDPRLVQKVLVDLYVDPLHLTHETALLLPPFPLLTFSLLLHMLLLHVAHVTPFYSLCNHAPQRNKACTQGL